jgi:hypothetical protein
MKYLNGKTILAAGSVDRHCATELPTKTLRKQGKELVHLLTVCRNVSRQGNIDRKALFGKQECTMQTGRNVHNTLKCRGNYMYHRTLPAILCGLSMFLSVSHSSQNKQMVVAHTALTH